MEITVTITKVKQCDTPVRAEIIKLLNSLRYEYKLNENPDDTTITVFDPYFRMDPRR